MIDPAEERLRMGLAERGVDVTVPNVARIYYYLLGGKAQLRGRPHRRRGTVPPVAAQPEHGARL